MVTAEVSILSQEEVLGHKIISWRNLTVCLDRMLSQGSRGRRAAAMAVTLTISSTIKEAVTTTTATATTKEDTTTITAATIRTDTISSTRATIKITKDGMVAVEVIAEVMAEVLAEATHPTNTTTTTNKIGTKTINKTNPDTSINRTTNIKTNTTQIKIAIIIKTDDNKHYKFQNSVLSEDGL